MSHYTLKGWFNVVMAALLPNCRHRLVRRYTITYGPLAKHWNELIMCRICGRTVSDTLLPLALLEKNR